MMNSENVGTTPQHAAERERLRTRRRTLSYQHDQGDEAVEGQLRDVEAQLDALTLAQERSVLAGQMRAEKEAAAAAHSAAVAGRRSRPSSARCWTPRWPRRP